MSHRQLYRTPPLQDCARKLGFSDTPDGTKESPNCTLDYFTPPIRQGSWGDGESMVKGMKDYQPTPADLQFMHNLKQEMELKKLKVELADLENEVRSHQAALKRKLATKEQAEAELEQLPSGEELMELALIVLGRSEPRADLSDLEPSAMLALVTKEGLNKVLREKERELERALDQKKRKEADARRQLEAHIALEEAKIHGLMSTLAELKSSWAQVLESSVPMTTEKGNKTRQETESEKAPGPRVQRRKRAPRAHQQPTTAPQGAPASPHCGPAPEHPVTAPFPAPERRPIAKQRAPAPRRAPAPEQRPIAEPRALAPRRAPASQWRPTAPQQRATAPQQSVAAPCRPSDGQDLGPRRSKRIAEKKK